MNISRVVSDCWEDFLYLEREAHAEGFYHQFRRGQRMVLDGVMFGTPLSIGVVSQEIEAEIAEKGLWRDEH